MTPAANGRRGHAMEREGIECFTAAPGRSRRRRRRWLAADRSERSGSSRWEQVQHDLSEGDDTFAHSDSFLSANQMNGEAAKFTVDINGLGVALGIRLAGPRQTVGAAALETDDQLTGGDAAPNVLGGVVDEQTQQYSAGLQFVRDGLTLQKRRALRVPVPRQLFQLSDAAVFAASTARAKASQSSQGRERVGMIS